MGVGRQPGASRTTLLFTSHCAAATAYGMSEDCHFVAGLLRVRQAFRQIGNCFAASLLLQL